MLKSRTESDGARRRPKSLCTIAIGFKVTTRDIPRRCCWPPWTLSCAQVHVCCWRRNVALSHEKQLDGKLESLPDSTDKIGNLDSWRAAKISQKRLLSHGDTKKELTGYFNSRQDVAASPCFRTICCCGMGHPMQSNPYWQEIPGQWPGKGWYKADSICSWCHSLLWNKHHDLLPQQQEERVGPFN